MYSVKNNNHLVNYLTNIVQYILKEFVNKLSLWHTNNSIYGKVWALTFRNVHKNVREQKKTPGISPEFTREGKMNLRKTCVRVKSFNQPSFYFQAIISFFKLISQTWKTWDNVIFVKIVIFPKNIIRWRDQILFPVFGFNKLPNLARIVWKVCIKVADNQKFPAMHFVNLCDLSLQTHLIIQ